VLHYNKQLQLDEAKRKRQQHPRHDSDDSSEEEEEEDEQLMAAMRERMLSAFKQQHDTLITAATAATANPSHLRDITEDEFDQHCLASSHAHLTLLVLHCNTPDCLHMSSVLATLGARYPAAVRCVRLRATGDNIARFPLAACPTTMAYRAGRKVGQWGVREWRRRGGGEQVAVSDVVRELRRCGLLDEAAAAEDEDEEQAEVDQRSQR